MINIKKKGKRFLFFELSLDDKNYLKKLYLLLFLPSISYIMYSVIHTIKYNSRMYAAYIRVTFFPRIGNTVFFLLNCLYDVNHLNFSYFIPNKHWVNIVPLLQINNNTNIFNYFT